MGKPKIDITKPFQIDEVTALMRYASEQGIDPDGKTQSALIDAVEDYNQEFNKSEDEQNIENLKSLSSNIITLYAKLAKATSPVNGRTLLETQQSRTKLFKLGILTFAILLLAIGSEILSLWMNDQVIPEEGFVLGLAQIQLYVLGPLSPFIWGAMGACVFLMKRLYDFAAQRLFDTTRLHGWGIRVLLGSIIAGVTVYLFDLKALSGTDEALDDNAIAFLIGLGVKVIYGAYEKLVYSLSERLKFDKLRRKPSGNKEKNQNDKNSNE